VTSKMFHVEHPGALQGRIERAPKPGSISGNDLVRIEPVERSTWNNQRSIALAATADSKEPGNLIVPSFVRECLPIENVAANVESISAPANSIPVFS
jgi:hypothetical protein